MPATEISNCNGLPPGKAIHTTGTSTSTVTTKVNMRMPSWLFLGKNANRIAPKAGTKTIKVNSCRLSIMIG